MSNHNSDDILKTIKNMVENKPEQIRLEATSRKKAFLSKENIDPQTAQEIVKLLDGLYGHKELNSRLLASMINAIFTQRRGVFLFSQNIMNTLLKGDKNLRKRNSINGDEYKDFISWALSHKIFERIATGNLNQSSVYELSFISVKNILIQLTINDIFNLQRQQAIDLFNEYGKSSNKTSKQTSSVSVLGSVNEYVSVHDSAPKQAACAPRSKVTDPLLNAEPARPIGSKHKGNSDHSLDSDYEVEFLKTIANVPIFPKEDFTSDNSKEETKDFMPLGDATEEWFASFKKANKSWMKAFLNGGYKVQVTDYVAFLRARNIEVNDWEDVFHVFQMLVMNKIPIVWGKSDKMDILINEIQGQFIQHINPNLFKRT